MNRSSHCSRRVVPLQRYRWICLVLALLLLYNPFGASLRSGHGLEVCHPASHRATVGSSELQHFSPANGWGSLPAVDISQVNFALPLPDISSQFFFVSNSSILFPQQFFGPGLWFRPPPAR
jgi:hypothetical protein